MANSSNESPTATSTSIADLATRFMGWVKMDPERPTTQDISRPWDRWELDGQFFRALSRWTLDNPETSLDRVLNSIRDGLENSKDLLTLIPESPFPARGLVTALAYLLKLGVTIRRAQRDVQEFARDFVRWVGSIILAFESAEDGGFALWTWRDLRHMRELVDKMCFWAIDRLNDGRWLRIGHGLMIQKEILEFKERISNARMLFQDLSAINMARGLDAIMQKLRNLVFNQRVIIKEIQEIRKTQKMQLGRIMDELELQKQVADRERFFAETLNVRAIASATYDSQGKRPCDEDTRIEVLKGICEWRENIQRGSPNFLWLTGDPGCGKSAVTASFARECKDEGVLWAQLFINRNNAETTDPRSFFPSIARQLANHSPVVAQAIHLALVKKRSLTDDISAEQAARLFTDSIRKASELDPDRPVVIVIDGLDETDRRELKRTAAIFSTLFTALESCSNVKVFISSRTENDIQKSFVLSHKDRHMKRIHLDTANPSSIRDVTHYVTRSLLDLVKEHDLNWEVWPGDERSQKLGERASGLFIWAVTAIRFIQEQLEAHGKERLHGVLDLLTAEKLHDINTLYTLILTITLGQNQGGMDEWKLERFRRIIGVIICLQEPLCISDLAALLDLRETPSSDPVDIIHFVSRFRTILVTGTDAIDGTTVPRIHKSVYEFITSESVDTHFRVDPAHGHLELSMQCLAYFNTTLQSMYEHELPVSFRYACRFWLSHLSQADAVVTSTLFSDYRYPPTVSSHLVFPPDVFPDKPCRVHYSALASRIYINSMHAFHTWDAITGVSLSHTKDITGVVPSADGREIVSWSQDGTIRVWDSKTAELSRTIVRSSSACIDIAISLDGKFLVSTFLDGMICLSNYLTGTPVWKLYKRGRDAVARVGFSPDGSWIISGCSDQRCRRLRASTGEMVGDPWIGHKDKITAVAISSNNQRACSLDRGCNCFIWEVDTGQKIATWQYDSSYIPMSVSFLPGDLDLIVVDQWNCATIQSHSRRWSITHPQTRFTCFSLSPDGDEIIYGDKKSMHVAKIGTDQQTTHIVKRIEVEFPGHAYLSAFSPNWDFAYTTEDHIIRVYSMRHSETGLEINPINKMPTIAHKSGYYQLFSALSNNVEDMPYTNNRNQRLDGIRWYNHANVAQFGVKLCIRTNNFIIAGYDDGSVSIWQLENPQASNPLKSGFLGGLARLGQK